MMTQQQQQASEHFLGNARRELADGDLAQASEKGWEAAAQMPKAVAELRGWEHHRHYHRAASRIRAETGDGDIRRLFDSASAWHENFYENDMAADEVTERRDYVEGLLDKLRPLLAQA